MNLRSVHALLIFLSAALAALFGFWCLSRASQTDGSTPLIAGITSFAVALGLLVYDSWFLRKTRSLR
jgi:hypothetical protein